MKVTDYNLYCSKCSKFVNIPAKTYSGNINVLVTMDLRTDEYVFEAICPECDSKITNKRRAF